MTDSHFRGEQAPLVPTNLDGRPAYLVRVAGAMEPLFMSPGPSSCGTIRDGVAFWFGENGGHFVVSLEALRQTVAMADARAQAFADRLQAPGATPGTTQQP